MRNRGWLAAAALIAGACGTNGEEGAVGTLELTVSGEAAAVEGYPLPEDGLVFADGWSLTFTKYLASLGNVRIERADGEVAAAGTELALVDLTQGEALAFTLESLPARRLEKLTYDIAPPTATTRRIGTIADADVERMVAGGFNYLIEGLATKGEEEVHFSWGIAAPTRNADCINSADDTPGVVIRENATVRYQLTLHLDHLFYDRLGSHDHAAMRFDALAAAAVEKDGVRTIELEALEAQRLASLEGTDGAPLRDEAGALLVYDPGSVPLDDANLRAYVQAASRSQGRFNGEGTCINRDL